MATDITLIEKREELKRRLAAGEYRTLVDVFLSGTDRVIRKITRQTKPLPIWIITVILSTVVVSINFVAIYVTGDLTTTRIYFELTRSGQHAFDVFLLLVFWLDVLGIAMTAIINRYIGRIVKFWQDDILDATESVASLDAFEYWLEKTCNPGLNLRVTIIGGLLLNAWLTYTAGRSIVAYGWTFYGWTIGGVIPSMFSSAFLYSFLMVILLSAKLRQYDLKLFAADPGNSDLISRLSSELGIFIYFVGIYAAIVTLTTALMTSLARFAIPLLLIWWLPITALFVLNQTSLSSIIRRAKWKTLNKIQAKVEKLQNIENFEDKETMEAINRLMDYHDRVKATRSSAIDLGTTLNFVNSLLLPLLAFLLGNLDLVLKLFGRKP